MTLEQRYVIKFFVDEGLPGVQIVDRIQQHYHDEPLSRTQIYYWIKEIKLGRTDLSNIPPPGREPDELLADCIAEAHAADPHLSARKIAQALNISLDSVRRHLTVSLGMKCYHMRWVPHTLTDAQKSKRAQMAGEMLVELGKHQASNFHFLFTGDESWIFYVYHHRTMWAASWEDVDEVERSSHYREKIMLTVFFNGTGEVFLNMLPQRDTMDSDYFSDEIIGGLDQFCYPEGRKSRQRKMVLHFDNAPIHNTSTVATKLGASGFRRMKHPPYSPDLAPCDFFLFGYLKERLRGESFAEEGELTAAIREIVHGISGEMLASVFEAWMKRLQLCVELGGEYVE
jgi:hypothetical protein